MNKHKIENIGNLEMITRIFFSNRRKMINKNYEKIFNTVNRKRLIKNLNLMARPSEVRPEKYYEITELYEKFQILDFYDLK